MILSSTTGRTVKTVTAREVEDGTSDGAILDAALKFTGETRDSLFGWIVDQNTCEATAVAVLYTD